MPQLPCLFKLVVCLINNLALSSFCRCVCGQEGHLYYFNTRQDGKPEAAFFLPSYRLQVQVRALCGCCGFRRMRGILTHVLDNGHTDTCARQRAN
jgi:hypothetical protein